jgi:hypothetical protein
MSMIEAAKDSPRHQPTHWTLAFWLAEHDVKVTVDVLRQEALRVRAICQAQGFIVPDERVCTGSNFPMRLWPSEALDIWWPDFKQRHGID